MSGHDNYARRTAEALQTMKHSRDSTNEEQLQHVANFTVIDQALQDQLNSVTSQLSSA